MLFDRKGNLHIHTTCSDGTGTHEQVAAAAQQAGLSWVIVTDHNAAPLHEQGWRQGVLLLIGQELHDPQHPHQNHLLVLGANADLAAFASDTEQLLAKAIAAGGFCVVAHPYEHSGAYANEPEIDWERWDLADRVHGLELWNYMSEFKAHLPNALSALTLALEPRLAMQGPFGETLARWDHLLARRPCLALGGSDAHATEYALGPLRRRVFSYQHLFGAVNTHALVEGEWSGAVASDAVRLLDALRAGRCYVAYDGLHEGTGFRFALYSQAGHVHHMGESIAWPVAGELVVCTPARARIELWHDGQVRARASGRTLEWPLNAPGVYRAVAYRRFLGRWRTWLISNAIRLVDGAEARVGVGASSA
ncbi:MAG: CehA/McbA family metallohydrolase [Chloroflexi bacterium]|nr:CehA/McbA family metallohydrolase [Chloroflexota bacterium]